LLLENGADPRVEDDNGTTAFELAVNEEIQTLLHNAMTEAEKKKEEKGNIHIDQNSCPLY